MAQKPKERRPENHDHGSTSPNSATTSSVFEKLALLLTDDMLEKEATSQNIGAIIEMLGHEKDKLAKDEKARKEAELALQEEYERQEKEKAHQREVAQITSMDLPLDWENLFHNDRRALGVCAAGPADALLLSLDNLGRVDIEYMAEISASDPKSIICALKGSILQNPETWERCWYKGWETKDQYLSGNLMKKRREAVKANAEFDGYFRDNVAAIDAVLPDPIPTEEIYITLGSPWVPPDIIDDFANHIIGLDSCTAIKGTKHDSVTGAWELPYRGKSLSALAGLTTVYNPKTTRAFHNAFGTERIAALDILERTLNMRPIKITDPDPSSPGSSEKRVLNEGETLSALEQQKKMVAEFRRWVWNDPARTERLQTIYESNFSCVKQRRFDGSFLSFPAMSPSVTLLPYQKDAVARMIMTPNTLLAHDVGAGKTYMMIAAGLEMKRMGISEKNLYVVPNGILSQWGMMFSRIYPNSNVLVIEPKDFTPAKRNEALKKMRDGDYDAILMAYSSFSSIKLSHEEELRSLEKDLDDAQRIIDSSIASRTRSLSRCRDALQKKASFIKGLIAASKTTLEEEIITFDDLGITRLFVDEAHNFKNVPIETKIKNCLGVSSKGSARCSDMMEKVKCVQRQNGGAGVVFATGTPITNSVTDAFIMQKYLQNGELVLVGLQSFDDWTRMFAEPSTEFEIDVDTSSFRMTTRLCKFHNLPELTTLLSSIADFHPVEGTGSVPRVVERRDVVIEKSPEFEEFLDDISTRTDAIRGGLVSRTVDNMLLVTSDGRKAALDMRLVDSKAAPAASSKALTCAEKVADIYFSTTSKASTQLIFCDTSTPKSAFNLYHEVKTCLMKLGVPASQIAFAHDCKSASDRAELFRRMNAGTVRILMGSTFKIGIGVNIQSKLVALHHLDVPWRPADMEQREGRMIRPGNENTCVNIYRYITEGSFDAYSWQLLETKQRFISALLSGSIDRRSMGEIDNTVLDYAEVKAIAIGDERIKERVETANELSRLRMLQSEQLKLREACTRELLAIPVKREKLERHLSGCEVDIADHNRWKETHLTELALQSSGKESEIRRQYLDEIRDAIHGQVFSPHEKALSSYQGFSIVAPANVSPNDPFLYLVGANRYRVPLGTSPRGYLIRIDNFLNRLDAYREKTLEKIERLAARESELLARLNEAEDYGSRIREMQLKVDALDESLGVKAS